MQHHHKPLRRHNNVTPQCRLFSISFTPFRASHRPDSHRKIKMQVAYMASDTQWNSCLPMVATQEATRSITASPRAMERE